ncbi:hypothetical protein FHS09_004027, partial [Microbulbifer rhizosphaerae]|nr:hypothetical protein [Microbulbifer rhizosphaerae]MBB3063174.1 hypothetical protein [Microbulbifer rhizosphaerae]
ENGMTIPCELRLTVNNLGGSDIHN